MASTKPLLSRLIKNAKKRNDPLTPLIDRYLLQRDRSPNRYWGVPAPVEDRIRPGGRFSPSSICGCQRFAVFKFLDVPVAKLVDPEAEVIFDDGKWRHLRLGWMCRDMEAVLGRDVFRVISIEERVSYPDLFTAGSLDVAVAIYGIPYIIDFKGVNSMGFEWIFNKQKPRSEHVHQLINYERMRKIKRGFLWYEDKNTNRYMIFVVDWSPQLWREVKDWCLEVTEMLRLHRLPLRHPECRSGHYLYGRCRYTRICYGGKTDAEVERSVFKNFPGVEQLWERGLDADSERE